MEPLRVVVLMGGVSSEREVSLRSGQAVAGALRSLGHEVIELDLRTECVDGVVALEPDIVFIALHGRYGEDGGVQADLERARIPYTGSGVEASRIGMDKMLSKCVFISHEIPTPLFRVVDMNQSWAKLLEAVHEVGLPLVVKPVRQGSSVGVSCVMNFEDVGEALARAFFYGSQAILERYVKGRELTVGILDDQPLPVIEIRPARSFFDYQAKYQDPRTEFATEHGLTPDQEAKVQHTALAAHLAIGCVGFSRVDIILEPGGSAQVLEVNTIPGMTERSLLPKAAQKAGIEFPQLCQRIIDYSLKHYRANETAAVELVAAAAKEKAA